MLPSLSTATVMFSGLVCVGMLTAFGRSTGTLLLMTGIVTRKMMSNTNMTSTSGVVLILDITPCSSEEPPTFIAILQFLTRTRWPASKAHRILLTAVLADDRAWAYLRM